MKNTALILLSVVALASARSTGVYPNGCPASWDEERLLPHPNCNRFYQCWNGKLVPLTCPSNLYFSIEENRCEWAEVVDCIDREVPEDNTDEGDNDGPVGGGNSDPSLAPEICGAEGSDDVLVANENCNQFYICAHGQPVALSCPSGLLFNPLNDQCDWPKNVDCGDRVIPEIDDDETDENTDEESSEESDESSNQNDSNQNDTEEEDDDDVIGGGNDDPSLAPEICAAEGSNDVLVANQNCNQFYICDNGVPVVQSCPNNLLFNPQKDRCDWPKNVDCGDRVIPEVENEETTENTVEESSEESDESSDEEDSDENDSAGSEDNTEEEDEDVPVGGGNDDPSLAPEICAAEGSNDVLVANQNCNQFYICDNGVPVVQSCPNNLLFNPQTDRCDWPKNVDCGDRVIPEVDSEETDENTDEKSSEESDESSNEEDSDENDSAGNEDNTEEEDEDVPVGGGNDDPSLAPEICAAEGSNDVLVANQNCNQFYICDNGVPVVQSCPNNLLFNPQTDRCDWPKNVDCGERVIPEVENEETTENTDEESSEESDESSNEEDSDENDSAGNEDNTEEEDEDVPVGGGNDDPSLAPEICAAEGSNDVLVANQNCNQFYICDNGVPVVQSCPNNLLFNPQTDRCDWPKNVDCGDRVIPEVENEETTENTDEESSEESDESSDEEDSDENDSAGSEDNTEEEDEDVPVGGGNDDPSLAPEICAAEGSNDVLVANQNCNQFYICDNGVPVVQSCPNNLLFNPQTDRCDWPKNVDCGDRVIPEVENEETTENTDEESSEESDESSNEEDSDENDSTGNEDNTEEEDEDVPVGGGNDDPSLAPEICAAEGSNDVLVANQNCNQFYICDNGVPVVQSCPNNLLFNPQTDRCDWPKNVDCGDRVIPEVDSEETDENTDEKSSEESDESSDEEDSDENDSAGSEDNTEEEDEDVPVGGGNDDPSLAPEICAAEGSNDVLVANQNCNQFYICDNGVPVVQSCPNNLLFNPQTDRCDWPKNVDCGDRVIPEVDSEETDENTEEEDSDENDSAGNEDNTEEEDEDVPVGGGNDDPSLAPEICAAEGSDDVLVANQNCNQFYICANGIPVVQSCPNNLLFNPQTDRCDWPKNVDCGDRVIPEVENEETTENTDEESSEESDESSNEEDSDENDSAGNEDNTEEEDEDVPVGGGNDDPSLAPEICAAEGSDDVLVANQNCNQFYICANGKPVVQSCPKNLLFNPQTDRCDWPKNVDCGDRVIPEVDSEETDENTEEEDSDENDSAGNEDDTEEEDDDVPVGGGNGDPSLAPEICASEGSDDVLVANEKCNKFYVCANGKPVVQRCPNNLLFNPQTDRCDWPKNVDCGDRVIPEADSEDESTDEESSGESDESSDEEDSDENESSGNDNDSEDEDDEVVVGGGNDDPSLAPEICAAEGSDNVLVANEDCSKFYICANGKPLAQSCPANLFFNPQTDRCDWPNNVVCGDRVIPDAETDTEKDDNECASATGGAGNDDPRLASQICASESAQGVLVAHEDCNQFYVCDHEVAIAVQCPATLLFNPYSDRCDWSSCVNCSRRVALNKHLAARRAIRSVQ